MDSPDFLFQPLQDWQAIRGLTNEEVGEIIGRSGSTVSRAKRGERPLPMKAKLTLQKVSGISPALWAEFEAHVATERARVAKAKPQKKSEPVVEGAL